MKYTIENTAAIGNPLRVFLDGVEYNCAIECDTEKGYIVRHLEDPDHPGGILEETETLYGTVTVEPMDA